MKTAPNWLEDAQRLRDSGLTYAAVAECVGVSEAAVYKRLNPDKAREWGRIDSARPERKAAKKAWHDANRVPCVDCGEPTGRSQGQKPQGVRCRSCWKAANDRIVLERAQVIADWWAEGLSMKEIADRLGWTANHLGREMADLRKRGFDLPHRYQMKKRVAA